MSKSGTMISIPINKKEPKGGYSMELIPEKVVQPKFVKTRETKEEKIFSRCQWTGSHHGEFFPTFQTKKSLPSGFYNIKWSDSNASPIFVKKEIQTDDLIYFPNGIVQKTIEEIRDFWNHKEKFQRHGFLHRRGYLFWGPAGSGKTSAVNLIIFELLNREGVVLNGNCPCELLQNAIAYFREVEPTRPIICVFEDIDALIHSQGEERILNLLDGEETSNYVLNIATTNYPEILDRRIINRPRRFDRIIYVDYPDDEMRAIYFKHKLHLKGEELIQYVAASKNFSFAAMSELVISTKCFDKDFGIAVDEIKKLMEGKHSSEKYYTTRPTGFYDPEIKTELINGMKRKKL